MNTMAKKWVLCIFVFLSLTSLSCAMGANGKKQPSAVSSDQSGRQKIDLVEILSKPDRYNARTVKVGGLFKGWQGKCAASFSITRSDWILGDGPNCIYVSGLLPSGLSTVRPGSEPIVVIGKVKVAADGRVHLKALEIKVRQ